MQSFPGLSLVHRATLERASSRPQPTRAVAATSPAGTTYDLMYYVKAALAGGICCSITHGGVVPLDVAKTRMQVMPDKYTKGLVGTIRQIVSEEGAGALGTGLGATAAGYFVQGWFKFGGVEVFKIKFAHSMSPQAAWDNRTAIYLASSAIAEFIADLFLCPLEAVRIRSVSDKSFPQSLPAGAAKMWATEGLTGFYAGLGPILFKQVPYTMAKFAVQGLSAEAIYKSLGTSPETMSKTGNVTVSLGSGVIAGVVAAIISHPADTLLSKVNKPGAAKYGATVTQRLVNIAKEIGFVKLATSGLVARCVMVGTLTAGQFAIFDTILFSLNASRYHFHDPAADAKKGH